MSGIYTERVASTLGAETVPPGDEDHLAAPSFRLRLILATGLTASSILARY